MRTMSLMRQTGVLTGANIITRALGFGLRLMLASRLGAEALGVHELSCGVHMLFIAPLCAGLPMAVSRETAKTKTDTALNAGRALAFRAGLPLMLLLMLLSPLLARMLGDIRTLPSLWMFAPCIPILALSGVYNGYCYGVSDAWPPALSELTEQVMRIALAAGLLSVSAQYPLSARAAIPAVCTMLAELAGLFLVKRLVRIKKAPAERAMIKRLARQAAPLSVMRVCATLLRMLCGVLVPYMLVRSGLSQREATARYGMLAGMVMPVLFLPGMLTGALSLVMTPAAASRQGDKGALSGMLRRAMPLGIGAGAACAALVYLLAPFIAGRLYHLPELTPLLKMMSPLSLLMAAQQMVSGPLAGLGKQKHLLWCVLAGAPVSIALNIILIPRLLLPGAGLAQMCGQAVTLVCSVIALVRAYKAPNATAASGAA